MLHFDLPKITGALFAFDSETGRIRRDYQLPVAVSSAEDLAHRVVTALQQPQVDDPRNRRPDAREVFRASINALGSNSRTWASFLSRRDAIIDLLGAGDPGVAAAQDPAQLAAAVAEVLGGQYRRRDARAMVRWAGVLTAHADWSDQLVAIAAIFDALAADAGVGPLSVPELTACLAGYLADPRPSWPGEQHPLARTLVMTPQQRNLPGMGFPLGSEFLRNLGWAGFKPDRHIVRLLDRWACEVVAAQQPRADQLAAMIGRRDRPLLEHLRYSLAGAALTPDGNFSRADNLVWLLGAYVERRNRPPSITAYLTGA